MLIVISPAKTLDYETPATTQTQTMPRFLNRSAELINELSTLSVQDVAQLMKLSDKLASLNVARYNSWTKDYDDSEGKQAILAFKGDVYTGLDAESLSEDKLAYAQDHLRMLSGLYGVLRPLDLMLPYRLEMGTKLANKGGKDLYQFWGNELTESLNEDLAKQEESVLVNLASNEYYKAVKPKQINAQIITPVFKDQKNGQYKIISFYAKKARGLMTRYIIDNAITDPEQLKRFDYEGYYYCESESEGNTFVFKREHQD
jgi:cytoplasmic iron level regulating protein YaaA (DUF328/UPF0246 family)